MVSKRLLGSPVLPLSMLAGVLFVHHGLDVKVLKRDEIEFWRETLAATAAVALHIGLCAIVRFVKVWIRKGF